MMSYVTERLLPHATSGELSSRLPKSAPERLRICGGGGGKSAGLSARRPVGGALSGPGTAQMRLLSSNTIWS